ncbi:MAG: endonuclease/exonuclease/phosphatase family protein [Nevskiaceae bacterium]|jgi:exonuclease III|nr:endonuclease/exonuclease/phosphatase family protein [Nevskiaceae bacterium]
MRWVPASLLGLVLCWVAGSAVAAAGATPVLPTLRLASWNLEWLVSARTARDSLNDCDDGKPAALPCDVARAQRRDNGDRAALRAQARRLNADVIAFQEVEDAATAAALFRGYDICITAAPGVQQPGFAVRAELPHRCESPLPLGTVQRARPAAVMTLFPGGSNEVTLLAVHLKSGCSTQALPDEDEGGGSACGILSGQVQALAAWVDAHWRTGERFILMGDFNRAGPDEADPFWQRLDPLGALHNASEGSAFGNCFIGQPFHQYIDHILIDGILARRVRPGSFVKHSYANAQAERYRLSDHCPISVEMAVPGPD